jgi:hypothetical protein
MPQGMGVQVPPRALVPHAPDRVLAPDLAIKRRHQTRIMSKIMIKSRNGKAASLRFGGHGADDLFKARVATQWIPERHQF